jgi:hypothetical protein
MTFVAGIVLGSALTMAAQGVGVPLANIAQAMLVLDKVSVMDMDDDAGAQPASTVSMPPLVIDAGAGDGPR